MALIAGLNATEALEVVWGQELLLELNPEALGMQLLGDHRAQGKQLGKVAGAEEC